jgi:hypothetical protein
MSALDAMTPLGSAPWLGACGNPLPVRTLPGLRPGVIEGLAINHYYFRTRNDSARLALWGRGPSGRLRPGANGREEASDAEAWSCTPRLLSHCVSGWRICA